LLQELPKAAGYSGRVLPPFPADATTSTPFSWAYSIAPSSFSSATLLTRLTLMIRAPWSTAQRIPAAMFPATAPSCPAATRTGMIEQCQQ